MFTFAEIRRAYEDVMRDLAFAGNDLELTDKVAEDLDLWGDDNYFFLFDMVDRYNLDHSTFDYSKHFEDEGELFTPLTQLFSPFLLIAWLGWLLVERTLPGQFQRPCFLEEKTEPPRLDLTVGDLIAWRLTGNFCLRETANIRVG